MALALTIFWAWRDGFAPGDLVGGLVTGVATVTYTFHSPPAGEYRFQCDVHPAQMKGTVKVV